MLLLNIHKTLSYIEIIFNPACHSQ